MAQFIRTFWIILRPLSRLYIRVMRPLTVGVRGLVLDEAGRVLLVRHSYVDGWYMPGGGVERGETTLTSIRRELDEEVGVMLKPDMRPRLFGLYANFLEFKSDHVALFVVEPGQYELEPRTSFEIAEYGFYPFDALPEGITRGTAARLKEFRLGLPPTDLW
jgi:8-oxo-dGTP pyrophosphatase MutT (NUDIX family)